MVAIGVALLTWDYSRIKRHRTEAKQEVVQASQKAGKKRNEKSRKIRSNTKPSDARKRLLEQFANGN